VGGGGSIERVEVKWLSRPEAAGGEMFGILD